MRLIELGQRVEGLKWLSSPVKIQYISRGESAKPGDVPALQIVMKDRPSKKLRLNSIKDPETRRILKPCEARAGHGYIFLIIQIALLAVLVAFAVKIFRWLFN